MDAIDTHRRSGFAASPQGGDAGGPAQPDPRRLLGWAAACRGLFAALAALFGIGAKAVDLPEDKAEAMVHVYDGGGVRATGPALLVRKSIADQVSLSGSYYADIVSNASIDVVTTASPFRETRNAYDLGLDYVVRDATIRVSGATSREPDYTANTGSIDVTQEVFGGMSTIALGYSQGKDNVGKKTLGFFDHANHWQYRFGLTQILTPRWITSLNFEAVADDGYLGSPYRVAWVFGAAVPERNPRTRSSRAVKLRSIGDLGDWGVVRADYRYFWDTWDIHAHTAELGFSRYVREVWLADGFLRYYTQTAALFYSDNATTESTYVSRNRQLSNFHSIGLGAKLTYLAGRVQGRYDVKLNGSLEQIRYSYADFTDIRTGQPYAMNATVLQLLVTTTY